MQHREISKDEFQELEKLASAVLTLIGVFVYP